MIVKQIEYHQMTSTLTYEFSDEEIIEEFGSLEEFQTAMAEETDEFFEFMHAGHDYDREDDIWTDRKGGYDVEYEIVEEDEE